MTSTYRAGYVPGKQFAEIMDRLVRERWPYTEEANTNATALNGYVILAEKVGVSRAVLQDIGRKRVANVHFDLADSILCALGRPDIWWGELSDIYYAVDLDAAERFPRGTKLTAQSTHCRSGHEFTPANTYRKKNGGRECKTCKKARHARKAPMSETQRKAENERMREYRRRKKSEVVA